MTIEYGFEDESGIEYDGNPHPINGDDVGPHPAFSTEHSIEQVWFHHARDLSEYDASDTMYEYHHSNPMQKIQSKDNPKEVICSDICINLERIR